VRHDTINGWLIRPYRRREPELKSPAHVSGGAEFVADEQTTAKPHGGAESASRGEAGEGIVADDGGPSPINQLLALGVSNMGTTYADDDIARCAVLLRGQQ
jgi:hypothetical protein